MGWKDTITTESQPQASGGWKSTITTEDTSSPILETGAGIVAGGLQGVSGGWADEIIAGGASLIPGVTYSEALQKTREKFSAAEQKAPWAYNIADIGASVATAAKLPVTKGAQIALGAAEGAGRSEEHKILGAVTGGTLAAAIPTALQKTGKFLKETGEAALPKVAGFFNKKFLKEQIAKESEGAAKTTERILQAEKDLGEKIIAGEPKQVWDQAVKYKNMVGEKIGEIFKKERDNQFKIYPPEKPISEDKISLITKLSEDKVADVYKKLKGKKDLSISNEESDKIAAQIRNVANELDPRVDQKLITKLHKKASEFAEDGFSSTYDIWNVRKALDTRIYNNNKLMKNTEAEKIVRDILSKELDDKIIQSQGTEVGEQLAKLNQQYKFAKNMEQATESALIKGRPTAAGAVLKGGVPGALAANFFGPAGLVTSMPSISQWLLSKPNIARKASEILPKVGEKMQGATGAVGTKTIAGTAGVLDRETE